METMGSVFFHLCCQTCPGWGLWPARMWPVMGFLEEGKGWLAVLVWQGPRLGGGWLDELKLLFCPLSSKHQLKPRNPVVQVREKTLSSP